MSGGQQINSGQGVVADGSGQSDTVTGSFSTASPGSFGKNIFMRLRSRKDDGSTATKLLSGSSFSGLQGSFEKQRSNALTTSLMSGGTGTVVSTPVGFLVNEVMVERELEDHSSVIWTPDMSSLANLVGGANTGAKSVYLDQPSWPSNYGHVGAAIGNEPSIGINSYRSPSAYQPDHYIGSPLGAGLNAPYTSSSSDNGQSFINLRVWTRNNVPSSPTTGLHTPIGTASITEAWFRYGIYLSSDILTGMTEPNGMKLSGFLGAFGVMWMSRAITGESRWRLQCYSDPDATHGGDIGEWHGGSPDDYTPGVGGAQWLGAHGGASTHTGLWYGGVSQYYLLPNKWHWIELHMKSNSSATTRDGHREVWFDDQLILLHPNCIVHDTLFEIAGLHNQVFHGGTTPGPTPSQAINARIGGLVVANRRIGKPRLPVIDLDINGNTWASTWNAQTGSSGNNMEYSNAYQMPNGRHLEFNIALHDRGPGVNVGIRYADFSATAAPTGGYLWPNNDVNINETDNLTTHYIASEGLIYYNGNGGGTGTRGGKIIADIGGTPTAVWRNVLDQGSQPFYGASGLHEILLGSGAGANQYQAVYNAAHMTNPEAGDDFSIDIGGGYSSNFPLGAPSFYRVLDRGSVTHDFRLRVIRGSGKETPTHMRHAVRIGDWLYWGGGGINPDSGTATLLQSHRFFRVHIPTLVDSGTVTQEEITSRAALVSYPGLTNEQRIRFSLNCADKVGKRLIHICLDGVFVYTVPADDGNDGIWSGPFTFGISDWALTISGGGADFTGGNWRGFVGTHRQDLGNHGVTFFRYNTSRKWNRITW
jgi:hypothetical protein